MGNGGNKQGVVGVRVEWENTTDLSGALGVASANISPPARIPTHRSHTGHNWTVFSLCTVVLCDSSGLFSAT